MPETVPFGMRARGDLEIFVGVDHAVRFLDTLQRYSHRVGVPHQV
jgi:hypothetical protein